LEYLESIANSDQLHELKTCIKRIEEKQDYDEAFRIFDLGFIRFIFNISSDIYWYLCFRHYLQTVSEIVNTDEKIEEGTVQVYRFLAEDRIVYAELRTGLKDLGNGYESYLQSVLRGIERGSLLYPTLKVKLVLSLRRNSNVSFAQETILLLKRYRESGIVGLDISGHQHAY